MPIGMQPGFADQMRQSGQMGTPPGGPPMGQPMPPPGGPPMGMEAEQGGDDQIKMMLALILQILTGAHNGGPPPGAPGQPGQSPGMPM